MAIQQGVQILVPDVRPEAPTPGPSWSAMRRRVLAYVAAHPSISIAQVAQGLQCSHTTASYHLAALAKQGFVMCRKEGRLVRHTVAGSETNQTRLAAILADPRRRLIVTHLVQAHTWPLNKLAKATHVNHGYLTRTLRVLVEHGFAVLVRPLARSYAQPTDTLRQTLRELADAQAPATGAITEMDAAGLAPV